MNVGRKRQSTARVTAGQAVVRFLAAQFSERDGERRRLIPAAFGIFGHGNVCGVGQALEQDRELLPYLQPKNEQAMVHTAIGYAKAERGLATLVCSASIGPGATNMLTGAAAATVNRVPVLLLPSDTFATRLQGPPMQALDNPARGDQSVNDAFRPVSVFFDRVSRPEQLLSVLPAAAAALTNPERPGAVTICLHQDVQAEAYDFPEALFAHRTWVVPRRPPAAEQLAPVVEALVSARRPLLIAGGGIHYSDAGAALREFAERFGVPVAETSAGKGALTNSPMAVGAIGHSGTRAANELARNADFILCVGTRLIDLTSGSNSLFEAVDVTFASINLDVFDASKLGALPIQADARLALTALTDDLGQVAKSPNPTWDKAVDEALARWRRDVIDDREGGDGEVMSQHQVIYVLNEAAGPADSLVVASGTPHVDIHKLWNTDRGTRVQMEVGFSTMGHEIPAALGIRMAQGPEGEVYAFIGDGTYLMGHTELVTAVQERLKITVILIDNHGFQSIHALQRDRIGRSFGLEFRSRVEDELGGDYLELDYAANARSYGCAAFEVSNEAELEQALQAARADVGPSVVICRTEPHKLTLSSECWWDVGVAEVSTRPETERRAMQSTIRQRDRMRWFG